MSQKQKKEKKWGIDTLLSVLEFLFALFRMLRKQIVEKRGGDVMVALRKLMDNAKCQEAVFAAWLDEASDQIVATTAEVVERVASAAKLVITYGVIPTKVVLDTIFNWVDPAYVGIHFTRSKACADAPITGDVNTEGLELLHLNCWISNSDAVAEIKRRGCVPAVAEEGVAWSQEHPDEQRQYPIACLGSVAKVGRVECVLVLGNYGDRERGLNLSRIDDGWGGRFRFLVRKKK